MATKSGRRSRHTAIQRPSIAAAIVAFAAIVCHAGTAHAVETLLYSFEDDLQGFAPNGLITVTQDTIGATEGAHSMRIDVDSAGSFDGALSQIFDPDVLGDPPGVDYILFDMTIPEAFPVPPAEGFADIGISIYGNPQTPPPFGLQAQFADQEPIGGKAPGTYHDIRIDLNMSVGPFGAGKSFNEIFGDSPTELVVSGFQLFINKTSSESDHPLTIYIDNVRAGRIEAGVPGDYNGNGSVDAADYVVWRNGGPLLNEVADIGTVSQADYNEWRARFGNPGGGGGNAPNHQIPEPSGAVLVLIAATFALLRKRCTNEHFCHSFGGST